MEPRPRPRPISEPVAAEVAVSVAVARVWRRAAPGVRALVGSYLETHDPGRLAEIKRVLERELSHPSVERALRRAAGRTVAAARSEIEALLPPDRPIPEGIGDDLVGSWTRGLSRQLMELVIGEEPRGPARADGKMRSILTRVAAAASRSMATVEGVLNEGLAATRAVARRAVAGVRRLAAGANRVVQTSVGITSYRWVTRDDERVRRGHRRLHNTIQSWAAPPIVDSSGTRAHPGEDYGCRCVAVPIV